MVRVGVGGRSRPPSPPEIEAAAQTNELGLVTGAAKRGAVAVADAPGLLGSIPPFCARGAAPAQEEEGQGAEPRDFGSSCRPARRRHRSRAWRPTGARARPSAPAPRRPRAVRGGFAGEGDQALRRGQRPPASEEGDVLETTTTPAR